MAGYNRIIMAGNLTKDPELRTVGSTSVCRFTIASNRQYKNKQTGGNMQEVCFIDIDVWGAQADSCKMYIQKGKSVLVEGRLKLDSWKDAEGNTRSKHTIVADRVIFLHSANDQLNHDDISSDESLSQSTENNREVRAASLDTKETSKNREKAPKNNTSKEKEGFRDAPFAAEEEDLLF